MCKKGKGFKTTECKTCDSKKITDANYRNCDSTLEKISMCMDNYYVDKSNNKCVKCGVANCAVCTEANAKETCEKGKCMAGFWESKDRKKCL